MPASPRFPRSALNVKTSQSSRRPEAVSKPSLMAADLPDRARALVLIDSQAGLEDPAVTPGYEQMHQALAGARARPGAGGGRLDHLGPRAVGRLARQVERAVRAVGADDL